jgi:hypothetical protein
MRRASGQQKTVHIPKTDLGQKLAEAASIKEDMTQLLRQLEEKASGQPAARVGAWRHDPEAWLRRMGKR